MTSPVPVSPNSPKLLGREIALWIGVIGALVNTFVSRWLEWSPENTALVLSAITALLSVLAAIGTRPFPVPLLSGALVAILTTAAGFGLNVSAEEIGMMNGTLLAIMSFLTSQRVSPEPSIDPLTKT
jgi:hypothetical protein